MKTKIKFAFVLAILVVAFSLRSDNEKETELLLQNIEAIASTENGVFCLGVGSLDCPLNSTKVWRIE